MTLEQFAKEWAIPAVALAYAILRAAKDLRTAKSSTADMGTAQQKTIDRLLDEKDEQWQQQVDYLQEQLDNCLDASRPHRPDI